MQNTILALTVNENASTKISNKIERRISWFLPDGDWVKLKTDGVVRNSGWLNPGLHRPLLIGFIYNIRQCTIKAVEL